MQQGGRYNVGVNKMHFYIHATLYTTTTALTPCNRSGVHRTKHVVDTKMNE